MKLEEIKRRMSTAMAVPTESSMDLLVPAISDVIIKYTWVINKYSRCLKKRDAFDSPPIAYNINGIQTKWSMSIRYWKGPDGKRIKSPVVLCLNLIGCTVDVPSQATVRFQFGVFNTEIKQWEMCQVSRVVLNLHNTSEILSLGYRDLSILQRHVEQPSGDVSVFMKLQLVPDEGEPNSLSRDLAQLMAGGGDVTLRCINDTELKAHSVLLKARSPVFAAMLDESSELEVHDVAPDVLQEMLRYVYTDHVDNLDTMAANLLAAADKYSLPGLKGLCERSLVETITPESVASLLLIADQFNCESLKKTLLSYCEDNVTFIKKSMAWKVMELVNPDLFVEACEAGIGSSTSSNLDSSNSGSDNFVS